MFKYAICIFLFCSCGGTTGRIALYHFDKNKYEVQANIMEIKKNYHYELRDTVMMAELIARDKYGLEAFYLEFSMPKEEYRISFLYDSTVWKQSPECTLGLIGVSFDGTYFNIENDLSSKEKARVRKRFEDSVLSKLRYGYEISD